MNILISGSSGLIGSAVARDLFDCGHRIRRLVRDESRKETGDILWDPEAGVIHDKDGMNDIDAVVHFAGSSIIGRWTDEKKEQIRSSRVRGTEALAQAIASLDKKPGSFISASAIGYYGNRGEEIITEQSGPGNDFLAGVCRDWEAATEIAEKNGIRVVNMRIGMVLSPDGGALGNMLTPFKLGLGGRIGSGRQYMSWISITDLCSIVRFILDTPDLTGPVNLVSPTPVTNTEFTKTLGSVLSRPTIFPMPAKVARMIFGELADSLLLTSQRIMPERLQEAGYTFTHGILEETLKDIL